MKMDHTGDPVFQNVSVTIYSEFFIVNSFKATGYDGSTNRLLQPRLNHHPKFY